MENTYFVEAFVREREAERQSWLLHLGSDRTRGNSGESVRERAVTMICGLHFRLRKLAWS